MANNSRWEDLYQHLKSKGHEVYAPGVKEGECKKQYLVIKYEGGEKHGSFSTYVDSYQIQLYIPKFRYRDLEPLIQEVKEQMKELEPLFFPVGLQEASYYDDGVKAHTVNINYKNYKKMF